MPRITPEWADLLYKVKSYKLLEFECCLKLLQYDGNSRISAFDALHHPVIASSFPSETILALKA